MSCANDTIRLLVASDISTFKFEKGSRWLVLSQNPGNQVIQQIRYYHRLFIYEDTSRGHGTDDIASDKGILQISFPVYYTYRGIPSTFTSSVGRSDTSKSLDWFCFMNSKAASMICPLGTLWQNNTFGYKMLSFDHQNESWFLMGFSILFCKDKDLWFEAPMPSSLRSWRNRD